MPPGFENLTTSLNMSGNINVVGQIEKFQVGDNYFGASLALRGAPGSMPSFHFRADGKSRGGVRVVMQVMGIM